MTEKNLEYYLSLPYTIEIIRDTGEGYSGWFARVVELPGCMTQADTFEELGEMLQDALRAWIEVALEDGAQIPEPRAAESFSGKFVVRVPRSLHRELVVVSDREGVSLNAFISTALGKAVGHAANIQIGEPEKKSPGILFTEVLWHRLSEQARHLMIAHGLAEEVQQVDESLFASWVDEYLDQARVALEMADYRQAIQYVRSLRQGLEQLCGQSPLVRTYCQVVSLLEEQVVLNFRMHAGIVEQVRNQQRILAQARISTHSGRYELHTLSEENELTGQGRKDVIQPPRQFDIGLQDEDRD